MYAEGWLAREREMIQVSAFGGKPWISPKQRAAKARVVGETLAEYSRRWIENGNQKPRTKIGYFDLLENHISPVLGGLAIVKLSAGDVNRWHSRVLVDKPTTKKHANSLLNAICNSAVEDELLAKNPGQIKRAMNVNRRREPVLISVGELAAAANSIQPERFRALVLIKAWCALRFGEVTELRRKDIDDGCSEIKISRGSPIAEHAGWIPLGAVIHVMSLCRHMFGDQ
jgi:integrase